MPALIAWWGQDIQILSPAADPAVVLDTGTDLLRRWSEPHRKYHTTTHLVEMFWALEELEDGGTVSARQAALGRVTAWFHDAVYTVPDADSNERLSARLATEMLPGLGFRDSDIDTVDRLVRASERHDLPGPDGLDAALHDADLWVLSAPPERFDSYCAQVRAEYAAVPSTAYAVARTAVLRPFLDRPRIYATAAAHHGWTDRARANLRRELTRLS